MSRRWLALALLLSVGVNVGILATLAVERLRHEAAAPVTTEGEEAEAEGAVLFDEPGEPGELALDGPGLGPGAGDPDAGTGPPPPMLPEIERRLEALADRLDLAGDERGRFLDVQRRFFRETFRHRQEIHRHQRALRQELIAPEPDRERVAEAQERLSAARDELDRALVVFVLESRELLGPAQEAEYLRFVARLRAAGEGRGPGGPGPRRGFRRQ
ncbi:MAG TPA: periplasmic heavy metal sensor [Thermoanaerobaculia bacterium]|nr:periplasmic heavy metal sensor [Thermoanaerobaculia bacterium]